MGRDLLPPGTRLFLLLIFILLGGSHIQTPLDILDIKRSIPGFGYVSVFDTYGNLQLAFSNNSSGTSMLLFAAGFPATGEVEDHGMFGAITPLSSLQ